MSESTTTKRMGGTGGAGRTLARLVVALVATAVGIGAAAPHAGAFYAPAVATTTSVTSSPSPSGPKDPVSITAVVRRSDGRLATGPVAFYDQTAGATLGTASLDATGRARITVGPLKSGPHTLTAVYGGGDGAGQSGGSVQHTVLHQSRTAASSSANPASAGSKLTFAITVTSTGPVPTGSVSVRDETTGTTLGTVALDAAGTATLATALDTRGDHRIVATYGGDAATLWSTVAFVQSVDEKPQPTSTSLTSSVNPSPSKGAVELTAVVRRHDGRPASGSVRVVDTTTGIDLGTVVLDAAGQARLAATLKAGEHRLEATYTGVELTSTGVLDQYVRHPSATVLDAPPEAQAGKPVTLAATVQAAVDPKGVVSFTDATTGAVLGTAWLVDGVATCTTSLDAGTHTVVARFGGDRRVEGSEASATITVRSPDGAL